jgi:hypothetical protein
MTRTGKRELLEAVRPRYLRSCRTVTIQLPQVSGHPLGLTLYCYCRRDSSVLVSNDMRRLRRDGVSSMQGGRSYLEIAIKLAPCSPIHFRCLATTNTPKGIRATGLSTTPLSVGVATSSVT